MLDLDAQPSAESYPNQSALLKHGNLIGWKPLSRSSHVASARLRCHGPLALLRRAGFPVELYREDARRRYRVVVFQKLYDPEHLALARRLQGQGTRVVLDLCDNHLYNPHGDPHYGAQADQLRRMLDIVDAVTASTPALVDALPCPATVISDGLESAPAWSSLRPPRLISKYLEMVWFGNWGGSRAPLGRPNLAPFGMRDLLSIADALRDLARQQPIRLTVISNSRSTFDECIAPLPFPTRYREWRSHGNLCRLLPLHDLCVLPIQRNPFTLCKSPNRLTLSLSLNVPVAATGIPSYEEFRPFCVLDDWDNGLRATIEDRLACRKRTDAGRTHVLRHHTAKHIANEWQRFLQSFLN